MTMVKKTGCRSRENVRAAISILQKDIRDYVGLLTYAKLCHDLFYLIKSMCHFSFSLTVPKGRGSIREGSERPTDCGLE